MTPAELKAALFENLSFPFEFSEVKTVESNCNSIWINLHNGDTFFIMIEKCEFSENTTFPER